MSYAHVASKRGRESEVHPSHISNSANIAPPRKAQQPQLWRHSSSSCTSIVTNLTSQLLAHYHSPPTTKTLRRQHGRTNAYTLHPPPHPSHLLTPPQLSVSTQPSRSTTVHHSLLSSTRTTNHTTEVVKNRWKYFRWTPRNSFIGFMYVIFVPGVLGYAFHKTDGKYNMRAKLRGDTIREW